MIEGSKEILGTDLRLYSVTFTNDIDGDCAALEAFHDLLKAKLANLASTRIARWNDWNNCCEFLNVRIRTNRSRKR